MPRNWIARATIQDFIAIHMIDFQPARVNSITGGNEQGKTTFFKAISRVFTDAGTDPSLIHQDAERAIITVELDNGTTFKHTIRRSGSMATTADGLPAGESPKKFAKALAEGTLFEPITFWMLGTTKDGKRQQRNMMLKAIDFQLTAQRMEELLPEYGTSMLDFNQHGLDVLADARDIVYHDRRTANIEADREEKAYQEAQREIPADFDLKATPSDASVLSEALSDARKQNHEAEAREQELNNLCEDAAQLKAEINSIEIELKKKQLKLAAMKDDGRKLRDAVTEWKPIDTTGIEAQLASIEQWHEVKALVNHSTKMRERAMKARERANILDGIHTKLKDEIPNKLKNEIELPVKGLQFRGDDIYVDDHALHTLSSGKRLQVSFELAIAAAKKSHNLKFIFCDNFEALDDEKRNDVAEIMATYSDYQFFIAERTNGPLNIKALMNDSEGA
jgi:hypothetical protein